MEKIKSIIWDSGNAVTLIENCGSEDLRDTDIFDESTFHLNLCYLHRFSIKFGSNAKSINEVLDEISDEFLTQAVCEEELQKDWATKKFVAIPIYAYIHSGINISTTPFPGADFDSGFSGWAWVSKDYSVEDLQNFVKDYNDYLNGEYNDFHVSTYRKGDKGWEKSDDVWYQAKGDSLDEDLLDFDLVNKIDDFDSSLYNEVRNRKITKNEVLEYLETL